VIRINRIFGLEILCLAVGFIAMLWSPHTVAAAEPNVLPISTDGFDGSVQQDVTGGQTSKACARLVNEKPTGWVEGGKNLDKLKHDFTELRFWVKSTTARTIGVRLKDATGQEFLHRIGFKNDGQWQQLKITNLAASMESWGGAGDKKWHAPCQRIQFVLESGKNDIWIDGIEATLDPARIIARFEIQSAALGNVFLTGQQVVIPVETTGDTVAWKITDFWGATLDAGQETVVDGLANIKPAVKKNGYFVVHLTAKKDAETLADQLTSFAVIPPVAFASLKNSPFGAMTHFAQGWETDIMPLLVKAGITSIRDEQYWAHIEKARGQFVYPSHFEEYMADAQKQGLGMMYAATFGNPLYTVTWDGAPATDEARDAYANYVLHVLNHYPQLKTAEIWNEYNGSWCGGEASTDRPKYYAEMLKNVYPKIKAAHPDVQVGGCACVSIPMPYIESIFKHGGLPFMDAVVIHPYRGQPEGVETEVADLQALIRKYNDGKDKPIWATENGAMPNPQEYDWEQGKQMWEKSRAYTARYLVRQYTLLYSTGTVERIYWYLTRDYNEFKLMGLLRDPKDPAGRYAVAPPYMAMATLIRQLYGTKPAGRAQLNSKFSYVMQFKKGDEQVRVCWATQPQHIALNVAAPVTVVDMMGAEDVLTPAAGQVYLTLTDSPVYVKGKVDGITEGGHFNIAAAQTTDILADYGFDYTIDDPSITGILEVLGQSFPISGKSGRVIIPGQDNTKTHTDTLWYRLLVDGKPAGEGGVRLSVIDPISFREPARLPAANVLRLSIANTSTRRNYQLTAVKWKVDDASGAQTLDPALDKSKCSLIDLPIAAIQPYRSYSIQAEASFGAARASLLQSVQASYNPCVRKTIKMDGGSAEWQGVPEIELKTVGKAQMAWDDANFYIAAKVPNAASLQFAMAPAYAGKWSDGPDLHGWYEFRVSADGKFTVLQSPGGAEIKAAVVAHADGNDINYQVAVPWASLTTIKPAAEGAFRLSLLVQDGGNAVEWGGGMIGEHTPDDFRICQFESGGAAAAAHPRVSALPLPQAGATASADQPLADSKDDYSKDQGKNNWFYGFYAGEGQSKGDGHFPSGPYTADDFVPMTQVQTMWGENWKGTAQFNTQTADMMHPGVSNSKEIWAVRRWQSTAAGTVRITGSFAHDKQGNGIGGKIVVDGVLVYSTLVGGPNNPGEGNFDVTVPVKESSLVDIAVTPGPALSINFGVTSMRAKIALVKQEKH